MFSFLGDENPKETQFMEMEVEDVTKKTTVTRKATISDAFQGCFEK